MTQNIIAEHSGAFYETRISVPAGESRTFSDFVNRPATVSVHAVGEGVSALVEASNSPARFKATPADLLFYPAAFAGEGGVVSNAAVATDLLSPLTALRVTAAGGAVVIEVKQ